MDLKSYSLTFNTKFRIIIQNFVLFAVFLSVYRDNNVIDRKFIISLFFLFLTNISLIFFYFNWISKRLIFKQYIIKKDYSPLNIINEIENKLKISVKNNEENIFYTSYKQKRNFFNDFEEKEVFFIILGQKILLNIRYKNESVFIYKNDEIERGIKRILLQYSLLVLNELDKK